MTAADRIAIASAAMSYAQANLTFEVGPAVRCDSVGERVRVVITDGLSRKLLDETFGSLDSALGRFAEVKQLSLFEV